MCRWVSVSNCPSPPSQDGPSSRRGCWCVSISGPVWGERDGAGGLAGLEPHGSVQDSLHCRIKSAAVAVASEEHIQLPPEPAWAALGCHLAGLQPWINTAFSAVSDEQLGAEQNARSVSKGPEVLYFELLSEKWGHPEERAAEIGHQEVESLPLFLVSLGIKAASH